MPWMGGIGGSLEGQVVTPINAHVLPGERGGQLPRYLDYPSRYTIVVTRSSPTRWSAMDHA